MNTIKSRNIKIGNQLLQIPDKRADETKGEKIYRRMLEDMKRLQEKKGDDLIYFESNSMYDKNLKMDF